MAGTTYSKFFWQDWQSDVELKVCSMGAQGWWMRLLCLAGIAGDRGRVLISGKKPSYDDLRSVTGSRATDLEIEGWQRELIEAKVCDVDRDGVIVSRRLRRYEAEIHNPAIAGGRARARGAIRGSGGQFLTSAKPADNDPRWTSEKDNRWASGDSGKSRKNNNIPPARQRRSPATISQNPSTTTDSGTESGRDSAGDPLEKALSKAETLCQIIGVSLRDDVSRSNWPILIERMIGEGITFEAICQAARNLSGAGKLPEDGVRVPSFFRSEAVSIMRRGTPPSLAVVPDAEPDLSRDDWIKALRAFVLVGAWVRTEWGPSPLEPGCKAPADLFAAASEVWTSNGNHPRSAFDGNSLIAWSADRSDFKQPAPFHPLAA